MLDLLKAQLKYEAWATALSLDSIDTVPQSARLGAQFQRALQVMAHIQLARRVWLARVKGQPWKVDDWFPAWPIAETRRVATELDAAWAAFVEPLDYAALTRTCRYSSSEGVVYESSYGDVLLHVLNHSTYHRGQIARLVTEAGGRRASTDYIAMSRRQV